MPLNDQQLRLKSVQYRRQLLHYIHLAGAGHTGGSLSSVDVLNVLYNRVMNVSPANFASLDRDRYVQSKGHSVEALFVVLADKGFYDVSELETLCHYQSHFVGHPTRKVPGVEMNTGALGHGLPVATGMAIAAKLDAKPYRVYTLLGDGELAEGSNWEAAMAAAHYRLDNLFVVIDHNTLQITGRTKDVCANDPLDSKWAAFGFTVREVDGHDIHALTKAFTDAPAVGKPTVVIANTIKGRGVSFMEDVGKWHHGVPSDAEMAKAMAEMDQAEQKLKESL